MAERMTTSGELVGRLLSGAEWAGEAPMAMRRELDQQANLALTNHMITSRGGRDITGRPTAWCLAPT
jgi:hypothetical protein